jgi:hypothetical protein
MWRRSIGLATSGRKISSTMLASVASKISYIHEAPHFLNFWVRNTSALCEVE